MRASHLPLRTPNKKKKARFPLGRRSDMSVTASLARTGSRVHHAVPGIARQSSTVVVAAHRQFSSHSTTGTVATSIQPTRSNGGLRPVAAYGKSLRNRLRKSTRQQFSTSHTCRATIVTRNMRQDEEGKDMLIEITQRAQKRLRDIATKDKNPELALRVTVQAGGCHGFQYLMSLTSMKDVSAEEDTVFETEEKDARVVMDEPSLELLKGSQVDFTMELIGSQFKITGNPAASSSCGCGTSFDIKI